MKTFSFVIPTFNHYPLLHQTLFDIYQKCSTVDEIIVVDDASTDTDYHDGLAWWKSNNMFTNLRHVKMSQNVGFLKASNAGLKKATSDVVCLLSNDVRIRKDIVREIVGKISLEWKMLIGGRYLDWDTGWNIFDNRLFPYLDGWLLATTRESWEELGYFDERFVPSDMEDIDISTKALTLGYNLIALPSDMTHHLGGQSIGFNPARESITLANKEKFRNKWMK